MKRLATCLVLTLAATTATASDYPLRWRVFADQQAGIAFRYPFSYHLPDQYHPGLTRKRIAVRVEGGDASNEEIQARIREELRNPSHEHIPWDVLLRSSSAKDLAGSDLAAKATAMVGELDWEPYDYYAESATRPHADRRHAPRGLEALLGTSNERCALVLEVDGEIHVLTLTGAIDDHDNRAIIDSVEVMKRRGRRYATWRELAGSKGLVIQADGSSEKVRRQEDVRWTSARELETANYHITSNAPAADLLQYGAWMEALYSAFADIYDPERFPPHKLEVMIYRNQEDFAASAASNGFGTVPPGALGFFSPSKLCIMAFETDREARGFGLFNTLAHEASHQFLHTACNGSRHVPTWINEGLAVLFEAATYQSGRIAFTTPRERLDRLKFDYRHFERTLWPLENYINHYGGIPGASYAEVYAMTHFFVFSSGAAKKRFQRYWQALLAGEDGAAAFEQIFFADIVHKAGGNRDRALKLWTEAHLDYTQKIR